MQWWEGETDALEELAPLGREGMSIEGSDGVRTDEHDRRDKKNV